MKSASRRVPGGAAEAEEVGEVTTQEGIGGRAYAREAGPAA